MKTILFILSLVSYLTYTQPDDCEQIIPLTEADCLAARPLDNTCCICVGNPNSCEGCEEGSCSPTLSPSKVPTESPITAAPTRLPTTRPTSTPTLVPSSSLPTTAPTLPKIRCDQIKTGSITTGEIKEFELNIPESNLNIIVSTCNTFTDFNTMLTLYDNTQTIQIAVDQDGCNDLTGRSKLILNQLPSDIYILALAATGNVEGVYNLTIFCNTFKPTSDPTEIPTSVPTSNPTQIPTQFPTINPSVSTSDPTGNPTDSPTLDPTEMTTTITTDDCPECVFNVTLIGIGNISIEECEEVTPTTTVWSKKKYRGKRYDSSSYYGHGHKTKHKGRRKLSSVGSDKRRLGGGYYGGGKPWKSKPKKDRTPAPTKWVADRICIERDGDENDRRRRLWGHRSNNDYDDGCNGGHEPTPMPTNGFTEWYKDKCDSKDYKHGWSDKYSKSKYGKGKDKHKYGQRYTSWRKHKDKNDEFITEVCVKYGIIDLVNIEDCGGEVTEVFLGICDNNYTDFNSSTLSEDDLSGLIVSINNNSDDRIVSGEGVNINGTLGILVIFTEEHNLTEFELCLGNVTVDSGFNNEIDMIDVGEGLIKIDDEFECFADGLPCLNFFFDIPCPPETTEDKTNCDCEGGITSLNVLYDPSNGLDAAFITVYYDPRKTGYVLCVFENVSPGDEISCGSNQFSKLHKTTYYVIDYKEVNVDRRRLGGGNENGADCVGKFYTSCKDITIGDRSDGCDDLAIVSYIDMDGAYCDQSMLDEDNTIGVANALINEKQNMESPLKVLEDVDPYILYTLIGVIITFIGLMVVAFCICIARKSDDELGGNNIGYYKTTNIDQIERNVEFDRRNGEMMIEKNIEKENSYGNEDGFEDEYYDENSIEMAVINKINKS